MDRTYHYNKQGIQMAPPNVSFFLVIIELLLFYVYKRWHLLLQHIIIEFFLFENVHKRSRCQYSYSGLC